MYSVQGSMECVWSVYGVLYSYGVISLVDCLTGSGITLYRSSTGVFNLHFIGHGGQTRQQDCTVKKNRTISIIDSSLSVELTVVSM